MPIFADEILNVGAQGYGFMRAAPAVGAVVAALLLPSVKLTPVNVPRPVSNVSKVIVALAAPLELIEKLIGVAAASWAPDAAPIPASNASAGMADIDHV